MRNWILEKPWAYEAFQTFVGAPRFRNWIVRHLAEPSAGLNILDVGCGPASLFPYCADFCSIYVGFDSEERYVRWARAKFKGAAGFEIHLDQFNEHQLHGREGKFDRVFLFGLLHHLDDSAALELLPLLKRALKPRGFILTMDPCRVEGMGIIEQWIVDNDRGHHIRTETGYRELALSANFTNVDQRVLGDLARIPSHACFMKLYR